MCLTNICHRSPYLYYIKISNFVHGKKAFCVLCFQWNSNQVMVQNEQKKFLLLFCQVRKKKMKFQQTQVERQKKSLQGNTLWKYFQSTILCFSLLSPSRFKSREFVKKKCSIYNHEAITRHNEIEFTTLSNYFSFYWSLPGLLYMNA